jgi:predicted O-linked N-acetylglucosamine transferase (SPINDLY family)
MRQYLLAELAGRAISEDRITMHGTTSKEQHMTICREVDIALDSYPYAGTTTTCDTLWMGIPVITMAGSTHVSRVGASLLARVGLGELVCMDAESYVRQAIALSGNVERLSEIRTGLRDRMQASSLCDAGTFVGGFEEMLRMVWRRWCESSSETNPVS